jgi:hypothetical protein
LENGMVTETKLDDKSVFTEARNKEIDAKKFTLPALKSGAIFDLQYTVESPFPYQLNPWSFQGEYPCLWNEYEVLIAAPYHYVVRMQGDENFAVNTTKEVTEGFSIRAAVKNPQDQGIVSVRDNIIRVTGSSIDKRWVKKNVPALRLEPYTTSIENYNSRVAFQLSFFQWNNEYQRDEYMPTWPAACKTLLEEESYWHTLNHENGWMTDEVRSITQGSTSDESNARKLFSFIRDNFKTVSKGGYNKYSIHTIDPLKEVFRKREGNVAELNLLLIAMLRNAGVNADPAILSTRENGIANRDYPLIRDYNYIVCIAYLNNGMVTLDASDPLNGFGQLPLRCYNGWGHVINISNPLFIEFSADSVSETNLRSVRIINDEKGKLSGSFSTTLGKWTSADIRSEIFGGSVNNYEKKIQAENETIMSIENFAVDSLRKYDFPLTIHYDFDLKNISGDILYFNPMLREGLLSNPFTSMERLYPVEMPFKMDNTYIFNMEIPAGYQVDEMPKSTRVAYNENEGFFEYLIQKGADNIQMRVKLKFNKAFFPTDEYANLRDFFAFVVKKESEQIVFKKIK